MKMNGIRMLALGTVVAGGLGLSSCKISNVDENKKIVQESGISAKNFEKLSSVNDAFWVNNLTSQQEGWQKLADSVVWSAKMKQKVAQAIDSTRTATRKALLDSLDLAKKAVRHLK